jgi:cysteine desulfurase
MVPTLSEHPLIEPVGGRYVAYVRKASGGTDGTADAGPTYLDTSSSEPLHPAARETMLAALERGYADPRRLHGPGRDARLLLDNARAVVAECLEVRPDEVTFTSSGSDAVHRGLLGLRRGADARVAHTAVEHSAVVHAARWTGTQPVEVAVDRLGRVSPADVARAARASGVGVVAVQAANHEVGTTQPVAEVADAVEVPLFVDACASMGRLPLPDGWAALAGSAHKWGGPAGVGVLLVRKGTRWVNPFPGDDRIDERATGFENVPAALGAAAALRAVLVERDEVNARQLALVDRIRGAVARLPDVEVVGDPVDRLPHLVTFSCLYVDGEALVTELDRRGYGVASGSACTASTLTPSRVLEAMGVLTHGNVRLSLARDTTEEAIDGFLAALPQVVGHLRAEAGL